jgi:hypothetical protein
MIEALVKILRNSPPAPTNSVEDAVQIIDSTRPPAPARPLADARGCNSASSSPLVGQQAHGNSLKSSPSKQSTLNPTESGCAIRFFAHKVCLLALVSSKLVVGPSSALPQMLRNVLNRSRIGQPFPSRTDRKEKLQ